MVSDPYGPRLLPSKFVLESDCCDGSDEAPGVCSNTCEEIGEAYRKKEEAERKVRKTVRATNVLSQSSPCSMSFRAPKHVLRTFPSHRRRRNGLRNSSLTWNAKSRLVNTK